MVRPAPCLVLLSGAETVSETFGTLIRVPE